ncbi:hypothetical protein J6590_071563 [Homalodisca vitripennis]|nr:hypothetical protein J6590_071563 [Homalodisca vitripennis]
MAFKVLQTSNVDDAFEMFHKTLQQALDISCPLSIMKLKKNNLKKIWDAESNELKDNYLEAINRAILTGKPEDRLEAAQKKKAYDLKLKTLRKEEIANRFEEADNKTKVLWNIINQERKSRTSNVQLDTLIVNRETISSPTEIANHLNEFFCNHS